MEERTNIKINPILFDPKSPSTLLITGVEGEATAQDDTNKKEEGHKSNKFQTFWVEDGVGCNSEETSALMLLLQQRDEANALNPKEYSSHMLSKQYRKIMLDCIEQCDERLAEQEAHSEAFKEQQEQEEEVEQRMLSAEQMELLKLTHTVAYLCEIYLLDASEVGSNSYYPSSSNSISRSSISTSGIVTADTVRYLRYCHTYSLDEYIAQQTPESELLQKEEGEQLDVINTMLNSPQPEYYCYNNNSNNNNNALSSTTTSSTTITSNIPPYWELLRKLILRGQFDTAWAVLSRHSACRRSAGNIYEQSKVAPVPTIVKEDNEAFGIIQALLLSAPLPGGRNDDNDDGLEQLLDTIHNKLDGMDLEESTEDETNLLPGIPRNAYKQWNRSSPSLDGKENNEFQVQAAMHVYKLWKIHVEQVMTMNLSVVNLLRRIPMIQTCVFDIILHTKQSFTHNDTWAERLLAELLFVQPDINKENIHIRARDWIKICTGMEVDNDQNTIEETLVQIMMEDAGSVIKALKLYGGSSGAALPTTMTALLCSLLVETGRIELSQQTFDIETELITAAASSILSSFSMQNQHDVGMALCTQFLKPHVIPENPIVTAYLAEVLSHHFPEADAEVIGLLEHCRDAVSRGSRRIFDACDSLVFSRGLQHEKRGDFPKAVTMIMRGLEFASHFGSEMIENDQDPQNQHFASSYTRTICFRRLTSICANLATRILELTSACLFSANEEDSFCLTELLKESVHMKDIISSDDISRLVSFDPSICLFQYVVDVGWNFVHGDYHLAAMGIINCLKEQRDVDGSVIILANERLFGYLLSIAYKILTTEDETPLSKALASFDVQGMRVLFCRMTQYSSHEDDTGNTTTTDVRMSRLHEDITEESMRLALGKGLMRAFIVQNKKNAEKSRKGLNQELDDSHAWKTPQGMDQLLGPSL